MLSANPPSCPATFGYLKVVNPAPSMRIRSMLLVPKTNGTLVCVPTLLSKLGG